MLYVYFALLGLGGYCQEWASRVMESEVCKVLPRQSLDHSEKHFLGLLTAGWGNAVVRKVGSCFKGDKKVF